jgi:hypothetical protein
MFRYYRTFEFSRTFDLYTTGLYWKYELKTLTLCPNGRYLYGGLGLTFLIQYDTWAEDVASTADTLLNILTNDHAVSGIYEPKITPRGELWLIHWAKDTITVLHNPEKAGSEVNISDDYIETDWLNAGTFPNNANYRIGPIDGSPCDTLGIDNLPRAWFRYNGMNLSHKERRFTDISYFRPETWHWDFGDGSTYDGQHPGVHEFPGPGEYYVCLTVSNENAEDTYCEWVEIDGPSSAEELVREEMGFVIYPNPSSGEFTLDLEEATEYSGTLKVFNLLGKVVFSKDLPGGVASLPLNLGHLPDGQYVISVASSSTNYTGSVIIVR